MSWSYSFDPASNNRDLVRFLIGDTDTNDQQLQDEEIDAMLELNSDDAYMTAVVCADTLSARWTRYATKSVGDLSISYGEMAKSYADLANRLRRTASLQLAAPYAGGISIADKESVEEDSDRVVPAFKVGMHDYPGTESSHDDLLRED